MDQDIKGSFESAGDSTSNYEDLYHKFKALEFVNNDMYKREVQLRQQLSSANKRAAELENTVNDLVKRTQQEDVDVKAEMQELCNVVARMTSQLKVAEEENAVLKTKLETAALQKMSLSGSNNSHGESPVQVEMLKAEVRLLTAEVSRLKEEASSSPLASSPAASPVVRASSLSPGGDVEAYKLSVLQEKVLLLGRGLGPEVRSLQRQIIRDRAAEEKERQLAQCKSTSPMDASEGQRRPPGLSQNLESGSVSSVRRVSSFENSSPRVLTVKSRLYSSTESRSPGGGLVTTPSSAFTPPQGRRGSMRAEAGASGESPVAQSQANGRRTRPESQADVVGRSSPGSEPFHHGAGQQQEQQSQSADASRHRSRAAGGGLWEVSSLVDSVSATLKDTVSMSERPPSVTMRGAGAIAEKSMAYAAAYAAMNGQHHTNFILYPPVSPIQPTSTPGHVHGADPRQTRLKAFAASPQAHTGFYQDPSTATSYNSSAPTPPPRQHHVPAPQDRPRQMLTPQELDDRSYGSHSSSNNFYSNSQLRNSQSSLSSSSSRFGAFLRTSQSSVGSASSHLRNSNSSFTGSEASHEEYSNAMLC